MENTRGKTLIFCKTGAIESPMSYKDVIKALDTTNKLTGYYTRINEKTGREDKYLCDISVVGNISHVVNLEGECVFDSELELAKIAAAKEEEAKHEEEEKKD